MAKKIVIAEKLDAKTITPSEAHLLNTQAYSEAMAELERRGLAERSVAAQEASVNAQTRPVTCTNFGSTVSCF